MSSKPLPPGRPPGSLDLLDPESNPSPRDGNSPEDWRADALGRSRHSRLASEVREPLHDTDPERAERFCAEVTRATLGDLAPALLLLSKDRRRRLQALTAWTVALFDFALRPGLAGLDGDRLAQINAWEFRTEEALDGSPPGQPVFVMMAREEGVRAWPREALDEIGAKARRMGLTSQLGEAAPSSIEDRGKRTDDLWRGSSDLGQALVLALLGAKSENARPDRELARLVGVAIECAGEPAAPAPPARRLELVEVLEAVQVAAAPRGWRRAASYTRRALRAHLRLSSPGTELGLAARLRMLALSFFWRFG